MLPVKKSGSSSALWADANMFSTAGRSGARGGGTPRRPPPRPRHGCLRREAHAVHRIEVRERRQAIDEVAMPGPADGEQARRTGAGGERVAPQRFAGVGGAVRGQDRDVELAVEQDDRAVGFVHEPRRMLRVRRVEVGEEVRGPRGVAHEQRAQRARVSGQARATPCRP